MSWSSGLSRMPTRPELYGDCTYAEKRTCTSAFCCKRPRATWLCCSGRWLEWGRREQCRTQWHIYCLFFCRVSRPWTGSINPHVHFRLSSRAECRIDTTALNGNPLAKKVRFRHGLLGGQHGMSSASSPRRGFRDPHLNSKSEKVTALQRNFANEEIIPA